MSWPGPQWGHKTPGRVADIRLAPLGTRRHPAPSFGRLPGWVVRYSGAAAGEKPRRTKRSSTSREVLCCQFYAAAPTSSRPCGVHFMTQPGKHPPNGTTPAQPTAKELD